MAKNRKKVVVTGDITLDWILARSRAAPQRGVHWDPQYYMQSYHHFGGASLLGQLIQQVVKDAAANAEVLVPAPEKTPIPGSPPVLALLHHRVSFSETCRSPLNS